MRILWRAVAAATLLAILSTPVTAIAVQPSPDAAAEAEARTPEPGVAPLPPRRFAPCAAFDAERRDWYVFGGRGEAGLTHHRDVWSLRLGRTPGERRPRWELVAAPAQTGPRAVRSCSAAFDPRGRRFIVFGGWNGVTPTNEVWSLPVDEPQPQWQLLCDATSCGPGPAARRAAQISYDPAGRRLVLFGGIDSAYRNDLWTLALDGPPQWQPVTTAGPVPAARASHAQVLDETRGVVWVAAGTSPGADFNDLWALDLATATWRQEEANGCGAPCPTRRSGATLVHDRRNDRLVFYGGWESAVNRYPADPVAVTNLGADAAWTPLPVASESPQPRFVPVSAYDEVEGRMLTFGGGVGLSAFRDTSALYLPEAGAGDAHWRGIAPETGITARDQVAVHVDDGWLYTFGGFGSGTFPGNVDAGSHLADGWRVRLDHHGPAERWRLVTPVDGAQVPLVREAAATASDQAGRRLFVVGGLNGDRELADVWVAAFDGRGRPAWRQLCSPTSCGQGPPARWGGHAVYDPVADRVVVFGGRLTGGQVFDDTWVLDLSGAPRWSRVETAGSVPPARWGGAVVLDPLHHRLVVTGGQQGRDDSAVMLNDTWALDLTGQPAWTQLAPEGVTPPARRSPAFAARVVADGSVELVMATGLDPTVGAHYNDVWRLDLETEQGRWEQLAATDCAAPISTGRPSCRRSASAVYDARRDQLVVVFGRDAASFFADAAVFDLARVGWVEPALPS